MPRIFSNVFGFSSTLSGFVRQNPYQNTPLITALRSIRDIDEDSNRVISEIFIPSGESKYEDSIKRLVQLPSASLPINKPLLFDISPSGLKSISFSTSASNPSNPCIELNSEGSIIKVDTLEKHGKVVSDTWFGGISWSFDERYVAYVAYPKSEKKMTSFDDGLFNKFKYEEDWGEKMDTIISLVICIFDTSNGKISILEDLAKDLDLTMGSPCFSPSSDYSLVYTAWENTPRKLGMIYCYHRPCKLYSVKLNEFLEKGDKLSPKLLTSSLKLARSGRISPDGKQLVFIGRKEPLQSHNGCFELYKLNLHSPTSEPEKILAIVDTAVGDLPKDLPQEMLIGLIKSLSLEVFPGIFTDQLPRRCFSLDGSHVYFTTQWGMSESICSVNLSTGEVRRLKELCDILPGEDDDHDHDRDDGDLPSCSIVDMSGRWMLYSASSPVSPSSIGLVDLESNHIWASRSKRFYGIESKSYFKTEEFESLDKEISNTLSQFEKLKWKIIDLVDNSGIPYQAILLWPDGSNPNTSIPLVVTPHGGPHSSFSASFLPSSVYLSNMLNAAVLLVNYRGSTGYGQRSIDSLLGNIGKNDVEDVMNAIKHVLKSSVVNIDKTNLFVVGGSHGGFLTGHLIGQYPTMFRAAAMRNPVTNIPPMVSTSDIPDWCHIEAEGLGAYDFSNYKNPSLESLQIMHQVSPIYHIEKVKTPTLILLGGKDKRVPPSQGLEYYHLLRARKVKTKLLLFPEDTHAIDKPLSEAEQWIAIANWFAEHKTEI